MLEEVTEDQDEHDELTSTDSPDEDADGSDAELAETSNESASGTIDRPPHNPEIDGDAEPDSSEHLSSDNIGDDLPVDSVWEDVWDEAPSASSYAGPEEDGEDYIDTRNTVAPSLQSHLEEQLNLMTLSESDEIIAITILDGLDQDGVLTVSLEDILEGIPEEYEVEMDEVEAVLHLIQHLDPVGVAARDLQECLVIQLRALPDDAPWRKEAIDVVTNRLKIPRRTGTTACCFAKHVSKRPNSSQSLN
ncbi:MAG: hypothetical protein U5O39_19365 [Gammaproteobacteria bacterium]|nr:hypothetical protein [Gammaproteobacteria bacterium]